MSNSLRPHGLLPTRLLCPWVFSRQEYWSGLPCPPLQGIFPTQGSNPHFPHWEQILYHLRHQGSPRILEWVACPFSSGSSWPRNRTKVSCIAGGFFTSWATKKVPRYLLYLYPKSRYTLIILEENEEYDSFKSGRLKVQT